jgi:hypothetical protein
MNCKELQATRKLLMLEVSEAAEYVGKVSKRTWLYWESGRNQVPQHVADELETLLQLRHELGERYFKQLERGERPRIKFYSTFEQFEAENFEENIVSWRLSQSVAALYYTEGNADLV